MLFACFSLALAALYALLLFSYRRAWKDLPVWEPAEDFVPKTRLSVLVPARNEAANIKACLQSITAAEYPSDLVEIIVLDDFSEDATAEIAALFQAVQVLRLAEHLPADARFSANKKKALALGVALAKGEIILCTDADCRAPKTWPGAVAACFDAEPKLKLLTAPVVFEEAPGAGLLQKFQSLDFLGMMGVTGAGMRLGGYFMANGANLAYRKSAFEAVGGYAGNEYLASGDDLFLAQKIATRWPGSLAFLKNLDAVVVSTPARSWQEFWQQRLRWGTKNAALPQWSLRLALLVVFTFCWSIWIAMGRWISGGVSWWVMPLLLTLKAVSDYFFLAETCRFFHRKDLLRWFFAAQMLHLAYIPIMGVASLFIKKYYWKGRRTA